MAKEPEKHSLVDQVTQVADPLCLAENFELVHVECTGRNRETLLRIFVDKPGGITLDDCVYLNRQLGDLLDVHIPGLGSYRLEVSSPGPKRPLKKKEDFKRFRGSRIRIETREPFDGRQKFTGVLEEIHDASVVMTVDGKQVEIQDVQIGKATLAG